MTFIAGNATSFPSVPAPAYDRSRVTTGIVHFGLGNFHRAHQAMFIDGLMTAGQAYDWGICGVGVLPGDIRMRDVLRAQDFLYTLVLKHGDGSLEPRVIGSIHDYLFAPDDPEAVIAKLAAPTTRIVSLTVTEGGYNVERTTGEFDVTNPAVLRDAATPRAPLTVFGLIVEGLARRRSAGVPPFTVMSCDNLPGNGHVAKRAIVTYATLVDADLARWIAKEVAFPNSMVDRITPVTTDEDRAMVKREFGINDGWPVVAEPFVQWAVEDRFTLGRPAYENVGVQVVDDVEPYELMKLRLLNASHQGMAYFGTLLGHTYAHEAAGNPLIAAYLRRYMDDEVRPTLQPVPGIDLDDYIASLFERFTNPHVADTLARLCVDSSDRIPKFVLPTIRANLASGGPVALGAALVASWARYVEGTSESGRQITVVDELRDELVPLALQQHDAPTTFIEYGPVFDDLAAEERFRDAYTAALEGLHRNGSSAVLASLLGR
ncbi:mannitol dehydrogenase family protein [Actinacidiphila oryziradicis]|uniref:Mannitol-1-phosphate 5-dehydrogenase n=1 Tax=Actinacidiphila oryziradicis TaxID=2571141 RepID=A0A4U0SNY6_9ACTN|nr:mannitol dehydrogenase family protein [Actinacidiphila oryziradicis]TKA10928.1 mannitol dehydrogenase family protein [Actinacidiphila oryziradicis]